jgi:hypothetical protein
MAHSVARAIDELKALRGQCDPGDPMRDLIDILIRVFEQAKPAGGIDGKKDALLTSVEPEK